MGHSPVCSSFRIGSSRDVDHMNQRIGMPQVVEELVAQSLALVGTRDEPGNVEQLDRDATPPVDAGAVVGLASIGEIASVCRRNQFGDNQSLVEGHRWW